MKRKSIAILVATSLIASTFVGCGSSSTTETQTSTATEESTAEESSDVEEVVEVEEDKEPAVISMLLSDQATSGYTEDWGILTWIEEYANVILEVTAVPSSDYTAKRELIYNSGNIPDIVTATTATTSEVGSGILLPISQYEDSMPNYTAYVDENGYRDVIDATRFSDGNYYSLPTKIRSETIQSKQWMVRTDIFEENNLEIPTTMDELLEVGMELKEIYPSSTPITNRFGANNFVNGIASAYGTIAGVALGDGMLYVEETDEWIFAPITDEWYEMLSYMNQLIETGVLDQEFTTLESTDYESKIIQGTTFIIFDWCVNISKYNAAGAELDEDYNVAMIYPPEGSDGNYSILSRNPWDQNWVFPATLADDEEHLAEVLAYVDWGYTKEAEDIFAFGMEGETYYIDDDGTYTFLDDSVDYTQLGINSNCLSITGHIDTLIGDLSAEDVAVILSTSDIVPASNPQSPLTTDQIEETSIYSTVLTDYVTSMMEKFIFGEEDLANWDTFVSECITKGSDDLTEEYNSAWSGN
ncbi:MAG: extracellular solute-binding protein [Lachnospiraceae bacterium]